MAAASTNHPLNAFLAIQSKEGLQTLLQVAFQYRTLFCTVHQYDEHETTGRSPAQLYAMDAKNRKYLENSTASALTPTDTVLIENAISKASVCFEEAPSVPQTVKILEETARLIRKVLEASASLESVDQLQALLPEDIDNQLKELLTKQLSKKLPVWRSASVASRLKNPTLESFNWQVDLSTHFSDIQAATKRPHTVLNFDVRHPPKHEDDIGDTETITCQLNKETLDTMLSSFHDIRDQLTSMAGESSS